MSDKNIASLHVRIVNCLQTILDLEQDLKSLELGHVLLKEFSVIKSFLDKVETVDLGEDDVERIERATENFLDEIRSPLSTPREKGDRNRLVQ